MYKIKLSNFIKWIFLQSYIVYNFSYPEMQFHFLINLEFKTKGTIIFTYEKCLIQGIGNSAQNYCNSNSNRGQKIY